MPDDHWPRLAAQDELDADAPSKLAVWLLLGAGLMIGLLL